MDTKHHSFFNSESIFPLASYEHSDTHAMGGVTLYDVILSKRVGKFPKGTQLHSVTILPEKGTIELEELHDAELLKGEITTYKLAPMTVQIPDKFYYVSTPNIVQMGMDTCSVENTTVTVYAMLHDNSLTEVSRVITEYVGSNNHKVATRLLQDYYNAHISEEKVIPL